MKRQKGFATILVVIMALSIFIIISMSLFITTLSQQVIANNNVRSSQSYYVAEAGIEDALLRLLKDPSFLGSYELTVGDKKSQVEINPIGTSRRVLSTGNVSRRIRKLEVIYSISNVASWREIK
ncbi:MAG: hypothetical protein KY054_00920 [Candidatus Nealsonbacteria bacterium]|nr:hypothetical protein [Candidatus Nealsonbacteria bacterium]